MKVEFTKELVTKAPGMQPGNIYDVISGPDHKGSVWIRPDGQRDPTVLLEGEYVEVEEDEGDQMGEAGTESRTERSLDVEAWVDRSMYHAETMEKVEGLVLPKVYLLSMSPDPLGNVAAMANMYKGIVTRSLSEVTDDMRREHLQAMLDTHLTAPLENIKFHFLFEGVDRSFTHQHVRQRTADYAQESLRFAVKDNLAEELVLPPAGRELPAHHPTRQMIDEHARRTQELYNYLVANGWPAEDARAYLPHAVATRIHYITDMRNMIHHIGNRLCTQAQLHWREVFTQCREAVRTYTPDFSWAWHDDVTGPSDSAVFEVMRQWEEKNRWQFEALTDTLWWKPACYQMGHCPFNAAFDRGCTIRGRVRDNALTGVPSAEWGESHVRFDPLLGSPIKIPAIRDAEWQMDRKSAWQ